MVVTLVLMLAMYGGYSGHHIGHNGGHGHMVAIVVIILVIMVAIGCVLSRPMDLFIQMPHWSVRAQPDAMTSPSIQLEISLWSLMCRLVIRPGLVQFGSWVTRMIW